MQELRIACFVKPVKINAPFLIIGVSSDIANFNHVSYIIIIAYSEKNVKSDNLQQRTEMIDKW